MASLPPGSEPKQHKTMVPADRRDAALVLAIVGSERLLVDFAAIDRQKAHERVGRVM